MNKCVSPLKPLEKSFAALTKPNYLLGWVSSFSVLSFLCLLSVAPSVVHAQNLRTNMNNAARTAPVAALPPAAQEWGQLVLKEAPTKLSARIFTANTTFENIFYNNLAKELEVEKEKNRVLQANILAPNQDVQLTKFITTLQSPQVGEAVSIGLADITILPLANFQTQPSYTLDLLDYPFMFGNLEQVSRKYASASSLLYPELNARSTDAIAVALMPYSFRIYATPRNAPALTPQALEQENLGIADSQALKRTYSYSKTVDSLRLNDATPTSPVIETTVLDYYDKRYYERYPVAYMSQHSLKSAVVLVGKSWWSNLSTAQQNMLTQALSRAVSKTQEEVLNFNSVVLSSLENQGVVQTKRVDYSKDFQGLRQNLNKIHYANSKNSYLLQMYNLLK